MLHAYDLYGDDNLEDANTCQYQSIYAFYTYLPLGVAEILICKGTISGLRMFTFSYIILCYVMLCYVMLCYVMLCYVILYYIILYYIILYYIILYYIINYSGNRTDQRIYPLA